MRHLRIGLLIIPLIMATTPTATNSQWQPKRAPLMTRWASDVRPDDVLPEYPRPQMVRPDWQNLNGLWDYAVTPRDAPQPATLEGKILVPFAIESALSGVMRPVSEAERLWYRRPFEVPSAWRGRRVLLHFGAVDWETVVFVNGTEIGRHRGGYDPFTFDITEALTASGLQEIVLSVWDPTDTAAQPRGKQTLNPHGIWYTPTTGIWQTVWLEPVPHARIDRIKSVPDVDAAVARVTVYTAGDADGAQVHLIALDNGKPVAEATGKAGEPIELKITNPKLWSPSSPHLYDLKVTLNRDDATIDSIDSYFGLRKIAIGRNEGGTTRILFNGKFLFQYGPLDQGFWPGGLYTAPTDAALRFDVEVTKRYGFNMSRKHVKVEPARWYYWCDKLGVIVWQDMPSGDKGAPPEGPEIQRTAESAEQFERELRAMIDALHNHPSVCVWVPFNEGWGQYDTARIARWVREYDPTRLVDAPSGWFDVGAGDVRDAHDYPGPLAPNPQENRASVLGEFGGLGLALEGHTWQANDNWGYRSYKSAEQLSEAYARLTDALSPLIRAPGLSAAVYTQLTDVEGEVNGLLTYDREVQKLDPRTLTPLHRGLIETSKKDE